MVIGFDNVQMPKQHRKKPRDVQRLPWPRMAEDGDTPLGVDVVLLKKDITKIVHKFFRVTGLPMEDLMQEVFLAIVRKNQTRSAHDPRKSSLGHYVYLVANNVCRNIVGSRRTLSRIPEDMVDYGVDVSWLPSHQMNGVIHRTLDIVNVTDHDLCKVVVNGRRCGHDSTACWIDSSLAGKWSVRAVCAVHESKIPEGKVVLTPDQMSLYIASSLGHAS